MDQAKLRGPSRLRAESDSIDFGEEPPLSISERARLRELEKEVRELKLEKEFLGKAAAFFASEYR